MRKIVDGNNALYDTIYDSDYEDGIPTANNLYLKLSEQETLDLLLYIEYCYYIAGVKNEAVPALKTAAATSLKFSRLLGDFVFRNLYTGPAKEEE